MRTRNCTKCGKPVVADAAHCPRCGRKFRSRWPWIAAVVVALLAVGTGGRALLLSGHASTSIANNH